MNIPYRQIRSRYDDSTITVYQAYHSGIAAAAVEAQSFVAPFKLDRMTWIKPSFLWMMYRCGWATKPDQERVLAIDISRSGFEWALRHSCLSHPPPEMGAAQWQRHKSESPVRIQWDPERDVHGHPLPYRSIQVGLSAAAVPRYVHEWIQGITDITAQVSKWHRALRAGQAVDHHFPVEHPYPVPDAIRQRIGAS